MINFSEIIIYEDDNYIIINKPHSISSLDERTGQGQNILRMAKAYWADAQLCHRLDKETSGALAIAKNPEAYRHISIQFEERNVNKVYHAVSNGVHDLDKMMVNLPITQIGDGAVKIDKAEGKIAVTFFHTVQAYRNATLIECLPVTGRMHQIRIHLSCLKASIVGDKQYGGKDIYLSEFKKNFKLKKFTEEFPLIRRVALHAYGLNFKDETGKDISAVAEYPKDFAVLVKQLEAYS